MKNLKKHKQRISIRFDDTTSITVRSIVKAMLWLKRYPDAKLVR